MADEKNSSALRYLLEKLTMMQLAVTVIGLGLMAAITWFIVNKGQRITEEGVSKAFITYLLALGLLSIVLIVILYFIFRSVDPSRASDSAFRKFVAMAAALSPTQIVTTLVGLLAIGGIIWFLIRGGDAFNTDATARGLITFSVAIVTVAIALILVSFIVFGTGEIAELKERFTFGKDILMVFVGILGTIMGFYYGSGKVSTEELKAIQSSGRAAVSSAAVVFESQAFGLLIEQQYDDAVKAFDLATKATPASPNVLNIASILKHLTEQKAALTAAPTETDRKEAWRKIYCAISENKWALGQTKEIIDRFASSCAAPRPTASGTPSESDETPSEEQP
jgi:hypothetical protein